MNSVSETVSPAGLKAAETATPEYIGQAQRLPYGALYGFFPRFAGTDECFSGNVPRFHALFGHPPPYERPAPPVAQDGTDRLFTQREGV